MPKKFSVNIIGGGLAGCEAAWFLANKGINVVLYEMRPQTTTPIHKTGDLGELVCSNSLKSKDILDASGVLKEEMRMFSSLSLRCAEAAEIKGGTSLIVDREAFSKYMDEAIRQHPLIEVVNKEITKLPLSGYTMICSGPLTSPKFYEYLRRKFSNRSTDNLFFFDAVAPIIDFSTIDLSKAYFKARYDKGVPSYLNCGMTKEEYEVFHHELINAQTAVVHDFEKLFEACLPIEVLAKRGYSAPLYGPLKPVGLEYEGKLFEAVIQLRQDDFNKTLYNLVGFQTNLTFSEQTRIIHLIPALAKAKIVRYGVIHRNVYFNSPKIMKNYQSLSNKKLFFAGQITGVEGYFESASSGILSASYMYSYIKTKNIDPIGTNSIMGGLCNYLNTPNIWFTPRNANYSLIKQQMSIKNKDLRRKFYGERALKEVSEYVERINRLS